MKAEEYLSKDELRHFRTSNNAKAFGGFAFTWGIILLCFVAVVQFPHPLVFIIACIIIGGRQLSLGILMHDCGHRSWFKGGRLNDFFGHWFAGVPILVPLHYYRKYHSIHHVKTGTDADPDIKNYQAFPVSKASMRRKLMRDALGLTGLKALLGTIIYVNMGRTGNSFTMGAMSYDDQSAKTILRQSLANFRDLFIFHGLFIWGALAIGHGELVALWWLANIIPFSLFMRIRNIAEHAATISIADDDVRNNTRTVIPALIERLFFCPHDVCYHCEHHLVPNVPGYHLKELHKLLESRGFYSAHSKALASGYLNVLKAVTY